MNITTFPCDDCKTQNVYYVCEQSNCAKYREYKKLKNVNPLYIKLAQIAFDTVLQTMQDGEAKHGDEWLSKSIDYHKLHALQHAELNYVGDKSDKHTNNGLTRNAMIKYLVQGE